MRRQAELMEKIMFQVNKPLERKDALFKLLSVEPDTMDKLVQATGWGREVTQQTLLQLIVDNKVSCKNGNGRRVYYIKVSQS